MTQSQKEALLELAVHFDVIEVDNRGKRKRPRPKTAAIKRDKPERHAWQPFVNLQEVIIITVNLETDGDATATARE